MVHITKRKFNNMRGKVNERYSCLYFMDSSTYICYNYGNRPIINYKKVNLIIFGGKLNE